MATETNRPLVQIDDLIREMTDKEYADYLELQASAPPPLGQPSE